MLRALCGTWWGASPWALLCFYRGMIRPVIDYGSTLYAYAAKTHLKRLQVVQNRCLRICLGAMLSSPVDALHVEAGEMPLVQRRQQLGYGIALRSAAVESHPLMAQVKRMGPGLKECEYFKKKPTPILLAASETYGTEIYQSAMPPSLSLAPQEVANFQALQMINVDLFGNLRTAFTAQEAEKIFKCTVNTRWPLAKYLFVDGSRSGEDQVGAGIYDATTKTSLSFKLQKHHSSYSAEVIAILQALTYVSNFDPHECCIFSDSLSGLLALKQFRGDGHQHPLLSDIIQQAISLHQKGFGIHIIWIPGHFGISGNEYADKAAKNGTEKGAILDIKPPASDLIAATRAEMMTHWQSAWTQRTPTTLSTIRPVVSTKPWFKKVNAARRVITTISRLRLGHTSAPSHLARLGIISSAACQCGHPDGSPHHIIFECVRGAKRRGRLMEVIAEEEVKPPGGLEEILRRESLEVFKVLVSVIGDAGL